jgi:hypothetical protein
MWRSQLHICNAFGCVSYLITLSTRNKVIDNVTTVKSVMCMFKCIYVLYSVSQFEWSFTIRYVCDCSCINLFCFRGFSMWAITYYLSLALVLKCSKVWGFSSFININ